MPTLEEAQEKALEAFRKKAPARPLWEDRYCDLSTDSAFRFLTERWYTHNEADAKIAPIPAKEYIEAYVDEWYGCWTRRQPLFVEKSRRLIISLTSRGLETWLLGLQSLDLHLIDQTHENSAQHLYRVHFSLGQLRDRFMPHLKWDQRGSLAIKQATHIIFPNGSLMTQGHQEAGADQGKGKAIVVLEELSKYRGPREFWAQAQLLTMGEADGLGGWVYAVANASPNPEYHEIKGGESARRLLGLG